MVSRLGEEHIEQCEARLATCRCELRSGRHLPDGSVIHFSRRGGEFRARISGQNFRAEAEEFQTHVRGVSDAHNGAFQMHYGIMVQDFEFRVWA